MTTAYELAVNKGFRGSETQWLASLFDKHEQESAHGGSSGGSGINVVLVPDSEWPPPPDDDPLTWYVRVADDA